MKTVLFLFISAATLASQSPQPTLDWSQLFKDATSKDRRIQDAARERSFGQILPKLCTENAALAQVEIPAIVVELNRDDELIRLQASAVLYGLSQIRRDSAEVLAAALPALMAHTHDPGRRIRLNSVNTLSSLTPEIPEDVLQFLIKLVDESDDTLAGSALFGIARSADKNSDAATALAKTLNQNESAVRKLAAVQSMQAAHVTNHTLIRSLSNLLTTRDEKLTRATLDALGRLSVSDLAIGQPQLTTFASTTTNTELQAVANQILAKLQ